MAPGWHPSAAPARRSVGWHRRIFLAVQPGDPHGSLASSPSKSADVTGVTPGEEPRALLCVIEGGVFVDRAARSTGQIRDHDKRPERAFDLGTLGAAYRNRTDDLRITSVFPCVARGFKACASFKFTDCCWWRSLAVDGGSGTSRGHASGRPCLPPVPHASLVGVVPNLSVCPQLAQSTVASSPGSGSQDSMFPPQAGQVMTGGVGGPYSSVILARL